MNDGEIAPSLKSVRPGLLIEYDCARVYCVCVCIFTYAHAYVCIFMCVHIRMTGGACVEWQLHVCSHTHTHTHTPPYRGHLWRELGRRMAEGKPPSSAAAVLETPSSLPLPTQLPSPSLRARWGSACAKRETFLLLKQYNSLE